MHSLREKRVEGQFNHVKSHLDNETWFSKLSKEAQYNLFCDKLATKAVEEVNPTELPYTGSSEMILIYGKWIISSTEQNITDAQTDPRMREYIQNKFKWTDEVFDQVDW